MLDFCSKNRIIATEPNILIYGIIKSDEIKSSFDVKNFLLTRKSESAIFKIYFL